jgi:hypothetical protein
VEGGAHPSCGYFRCLPMWFVRDDGETSNPASGATPQRTDPNGASELKIEVRSGVRTKLSSEKFKTDMGERLNTEEKCYGACG